MCTVAIGLCFLTLIQFFRKNENFEFFEIAMTKNQFQATISFAILGITLQIGRIYSSLFSILMAYRVNNGDASDDFFKQLFFIIKNNPSSFNPYYSSYTGNTVINGIEASVSYVSIPFLVTFPILISLAKDLSSDFSVLKNRVEIQTAVSWVDYANFIIFLFCGIYISYVLSPLDALVATIDNTFRHDFFSSYFGKFQRFAAAICVFIFLIISFMVIRFFQLVHFRKSLARH